MRFNKKKYFISIFILCFISVSHVFYSETKINKKLWKKAIKIHEQAIVIDTHCDTPMIMLDRGVDVGKRSDRAEVDFIKMKEGGLDASFFAVYVSNRLDKKQPSKKALEMIDEIHNQVEKYSDLATLAYSSRDILDIHQTGKRAILIGMENGGPIEGNLRLLRNFYRLGVRYITLTHSSHNNICDSSTGGDPKWNGLSDFGKEVVKEMNRLGMLIDVSHISDKAFWDVIEVSRSPVFASHSCVRSLCNTPRNLTDKMIKALAAMEGVVHLNFYSGFLDESFRRKTKEVEQKLAPEIKKLREKYKANQSSLWDAFGKLWKKHAPPSTTIDVLIDHIDHVVKLVGIDYVGLGSDYDGAGSFPQGLENSSKLQWLTYHLLKRGYSEGDIKKILGKNFLRVFKKVENLSEKRINK